MQEDIKKNIPNASISLVGDFEGINIEAKKDHDNDAKIVSAVWYEKIRAAVEYQESHLIFKNAIARIIKRNILLIPKIKPKKLLNNLINELVWANYITPKTIDDKKFEEIERVLDKCLEIIRYANSSHKTKTELVQYLSGLCSAEIEEIINPHEADKKFIEFAYNAVKKNFDHKNSQISIEDSDIQIKLALITNILKPDASLLGYFTLLMIEPNWGKLTSQEIRKIAKSIDPFINRIDKHIHHPFRNQYLIATRNLASPFIVFRTTLLSRDITKKIVEANPSLLIQNCMEVYESLKRESNSRIWRGTLRALIFVFLTKIILAFILEVPIDRALHGEIIWLALIVNISLPPFLMFLSGLTIPKISNRNSNQVKESLEEVIWQGKLATEKKIEIGYKKETRSATVFGYILTLISLAILVFVVWGLIILQFSLISIILFFIFVSAVSFLSFRIRTNSKELIVKRGRQDSITSVVELIFLPFIKIGRIMSDQLNRLNPFLLALDFLIEAPLKTIIRILRSWFTFISSKKEELEY